MAASTLRTIDTDHEDMIHDAQLDYYSRRLATCSSDKSIRIFNVVGSEHVFDAELKQHEGPVWEVSWAHPKFGTVLASCGYDRRAIVWREVTPGSWEAEHVVTAESSVNSVSWAPHEAGSLMLACASSDGRVRVATKTAAGGWADEAELPDFTEGLLAVSWAPSAHLGAVLGAEKTMRLVTAGCNGSMQVWARSSAGEWRKDAHGELTGHTRWVRDVAWAPATGLSVNQIASCSEDGTVLVWEQAKAGGPWEPKLVHDFKAPVWRASWSLTGGILAVTSGDPSGEAAVTLFKQTLLGDWAQVDAPDVGEAAAAGAGEAAAAAASAAVA